jgi:hypothetical protein
MLFLGDKLSGRSCYREERRIQIIPGFRIGEDFSPIIRLPLEDENVCFSLLLAVGPIQGILALPSHEYFVLYVVEEMHVSGTV